MFYKLIPVMHQITLYVFIAVLLIGLHAKTLVEDESTDKVQNVDHP
ncbi:unnamed protein product, partial [Didymodactylos carnosus]